MSIQEEIEIDLISDQDRLEIGATLARDRLDVEIVICNSN